MALFTRVRYRTVPLRSVPKSSTERGCIHKCTEKRSSGPFQNRSRNWAVHKSEPEIGTRRYRTILFSFEQKQYDIILFFSHVNRKTGQFKPTFRTCLVSTGDTKLVSMITSNVEVEVRPPD